MKEQRRKFQEIWLMFFLVRIELIIDHMQIFVKTSEKSKVYLKKKSEVANKLYYAPAHPPNSNDILQ